MKTKEEIYRQLSEKLVSDLTVNGRETSKKCVVEATQDIAENRYTAKVAMDLMGVCKQTRTTEDDELSLFMTLNEALKRVEKVTEIYLNQPKEPQP